MTSFFEKKYGLLVDDLKTSLLIHHTRSLNKDLAAIKDPLKQSPQHTQIIHMYFMNEHKTNLINRK